jgi:hypothetical protein
VKVVEGMVGLGNIHHADAPIDLAGGTVYIISRRKLLLGGSMLMFFFLF